MIGYSRCVGLFESFPVLEVDVFINPVNTVWMSKQIGLIDTVPAIRKRGDDFSAVFVKQSGGDDPRWVLDWFWNVLGWNSGTTLAAKNYSVLEVRQGLASETTGRAFPFPGVGPTIDMAPTASESVEVNTGCSGSLRLTGRRLLLQLHNGGTNVPTSFQFGAYLRAV